LAAAAAVRGYRPYSQPDNDQVLGVSTTVQEAPVSRRQDRSGTQKISFGSSCSQIAS